jgi:hypothetical protein
VSPLEAARGAFRVVPLRGGIPEERHQPVPEFLQHVPDKADHGLRTAFIKDGVRAEDGSEAFTLPHPGGLPWSGPAMACGALSNVILSPIISNG